MYHSQGYKLKSLNTFMLRKTKYFSHFLKDKGFKDTVVNRALTSLRGGSFEITLTVPLSYVFGLLCVKGLYSCST